MYHAARMRRYLLSLELPEPNEFKTLEKWLARGQVRSARPSMAFSRCFD